MSKLFLILILLASVYPSFGCASGLNIIPTADVLPQGEMYFATERWCTLNQTANAESYNYLQLGLGHGIEFGYDIYPDDQGIWNIKVALPGKEGKPVVALGIQNVGDGLRSWPYAVGSISVGAGRVHLGMVDIEGNIRPMFGYDHPLGEVASFQLDYTAGSENCGSMGCWVNLGRGMGINAAYVLNNSGTDRSGLSLILGWSFGIL